MLRLPSSSGFKETYLLSSQPAELLPEWCNTGCCLDALCAVAASSQVQQLVGALQQVEAALIYSGICSTARSLH